MPDASWTREPRPLAVLAGALLFVAFLPGPGWPLVFLALVPWILAQESVVRARGSAREAARIGALFAGVFWALHLAWVLLLIPRIGELWPLTGWAGQVLLLALLGSGAGVLFHRLRRAGRSLPMAAVLAFMSVEWIRGHLLGPLRFPWSPLALPLTAEPALLQPGAWIGEWGLGVGVVLVNGLLAWTLLVRNPAWPRRLLPAIGALALVTVWIGTGTARLQEAEMRSAIRAGVVQPGLLLAERRSETGTTDRALETAAEGIEALLDRMWADTSLPRVAVLPETHLPPEATGPDGLDPQVRRAFTDWSRRLDAEVLVGGYGRTEGGMTNALYRFTPTQAGDEEPDGSPGRDRYDKSALVPGVEWGGPDGLVRGAAPAPLTGPGSPGPLICIESAWTGHGIRHARAGARWLVNVTNDAWLAEVPLWTRTPAFRQHPAHLQLRTVETGLGALRVGNNGLTGVVDPLGRWTRLLPPHGPGAAWTTVDILVSEDSGDAPEPEGSGQPRGADRNESLYLTAYVRWGHPVPGAVSILTLVLVAFGVRSGSRRETGPRGVDRS